MKLEKIRLRSTPSLGQFHSSRGIPMITAQSIEDIRTRASIVDVVRESREVKRVGSRWVCLCPFHDERSPSCYLQEDRNSYHCFGCGASGNVISFVMHNQGVSFPDALEYLADRFGIPLVRTSISGVSGLQQDERRRLTEILHRARQFYFEKLVDRPPGVVAGYCIERRLNRAAIETFGIGFAPRGDPSLTKILLREGFSEAELITAGVSRRSESTGQVYDAFSGRLMFPIIGDGGKVVAFGGRLIPGLFTDAKDRPKYLNSPESPLYKKNQILFGLPQAVAQARTTGEMYLVEGYLDVVGLWQAGVKHAVASCGTAVTPGHATKLVGIAKRLILLFDGDEAGRKAAARCFKVLLGAPLDVWVSFLPEGEDPHDCAGRLGEDVALFLRGLGRKSLVETYIESRLRELADEEGNIGAASRALIAQEIVDAAGTVDNPLIRSEVLRETAKKLKLEEASLAVTRGSQGARVIGSGTPRNLSESEFTPVLDLSPLDRRILEACMRYWEELPGEVIKHPEVCEQMDPLALQVVLDLHAISSSSEEESGKRRQVKQLLERDGGGWKLLWKKAFDLDRAQGTDLRKQFADCVQTFKHNFQVSSVERAIEQTLDAKERGDLYQKLIFLKKTKK